MRKAIIINKALILFTILFIIIAALSFAAFEKGEKVCAEAGKCSEVKPSITNGEMIWDVFSRRLISFVSLK